MTYLFRSTSKGPLFPFPINRALDVSNINWLSQFLVAMSYYIPTYLDSCVYCRSGYLQRNQHKQHHRTVEQDLYMSLTYSVILLHKSWNMMPSLSNHPSHRQLETERLLFTWVSQEEKFK